MAFWDNIIKKQNEINEKKKNLNDMIKEGGLTFAVGQAKYLGGHPELLGEKKGTIKINGLGLFFILDKTSDSIFIPVRSIAIGEFKTGEEVVGNTLYTRLLAMNGFKFAMNKKTQNKRLFLTVSYAEDSVENNVLFETKFANEFASAITKIKQDYIRDNKVNTTTTISELLKQLSELRALGIVTPEEFDTKKRELLTKI